MRVLNLVLSTLMAMVLIVVVFSAGPTLEGKFFPVYSRFEIYSMEPTATGVRVVFKYTKFRNCDPQGYSWYNGDLGKGVKVLNIKREAPPAPRPLGSQLSSPIVIEDVTTLEFPDVNATLYSRCHPLWITETSVRP